MRQKLIRLTVVERKKRKEGKKENRHLFIIFPIPLVSFGWQQVQGNLVCIRYRNIQFIKGKQLKDKVICIRIGLQNCVTFSAGVQPQLIQGI